ncbi:Six-hairpin glycosidase, partial [Thozetella sp. PMI_491]
MGYSSLWAIVACFAPSILGGGIERRHDVFEFLPRGLSLGKQLDVNTGAFTEFTVSSCSPIATLDYGQERAGFAFFEVSRLGSPVQVEVKYSEQFDALGHPLADGPYSFQNQLSNSYRVETYNITSPGRFRAPLLQGGQRWQSIRLLLGGSVTFNRVGFEATVDATDIQELPGTFNSSDAKLNEIWKLGAVAASVACVAKGSQPAIWEVDPEKGVYLRSLRPSQTILGAYFENYILEFDTNIDRGGIWWSAVGSFTLLLISELPAATTFVNTNQSLITPNSIMLSWGYDIVNQTTLTSYSLNSFKVPFTVKEKAWYRLTTVLSPTGHVSVSIDGQEIFDINMEDYYTGPPGPFSGSFSTFKGSFGFGAWQDHAAYVRNVVVTASNGSRIYENPMTSPTVLSEYGTGPNVESVCLDGPKRDRLVWLGDYYHTARIIAVSTGRSDLAQGTFKMFLAGQLQNGEFNISPPMGYDPVKSEPFATDDSFGLSDYQLLGLSALSTYMRETNDIEFVRNTWPQWLKQVNWLIKKLNATGDGLWYAPSAFLGPSAGGSAVSCLALQALHELADIAETLGDIGTQTGCLDAAEGLQKAINAHLWNDELGFYGLSPDDRGNFSVAATAFCITSGAASAAQTAHLISALPQLALGPGYKDNSAAASSDPGLTISPNTNGFLLEALFKAGAFDLARSLIDSLWGAMIANPRTSSGASWEYIDVQGNPGLSRFTSLAHPWGGAATYILTEWIAGIRAAEGVGGFGYANWVFDPEAGVALGLQRASARVPTPQGTLSVEWKVVAEDLWLSVQAPKDSFGTFRFRGAERSLAGEAEYTFVVGL